MLCNMQCMHDVRICSWSWKAPKQSGIHASVLLTDSKFYQPKWLLLDFVIWVSLFTTSLIFHYRNSNISSHCFTVDISPFGGCYYSWEVSIVLLPVLRQRWITSGFRHHIFSICSLQCTDVFKLSWDYVLLRHQRKGHQTSITHSSIGAYSYSYTLLVYQSNIYKYRSLASLSVESFLLN